MSKKQNKIQYTVRNIPQQLDVKIRKLAKEQDKSLNQVVLDVLCAIQKGEDLLGPSRYHDLDFLKGSWVEDPEFDKSMEDQSKIDEDLWK